MSFLRTCLFLSCFLCVEGAGVETFKITDTGYDVKGRGGFGWENCGIPTTPILVQSFNVTPDPIIVAQGTLMFMSAVITVSQDIGVKGQHLTLDSALKIKVDNQYKDICDLVDFTCHIDDFCRALSSPKSKLCPPALEFFGFNCSCPIRANTYEIPNIPVRVPKFDVDVHGSFEAAVAIKDYYSVLGCVQIKFCVNRCSP